jgi:hypothetical protein
VQEEQPFRSRLDCRLGPGRQLPPASLRGGDRADAMPPGHRQRSIRRTAIHNHDRPPSGQGGSGDGFKGAVERSGAVKRRYDNADGGVGDGQGELRKKRSALDPSSYHYRTGRVSVLDRFSTGGAATAQQDFHLGAAVSHESHFGVGLPGQCSDQQQAQSASLVGG